MKRDDLFSRLQLDFKCDVDWSQMDGGARERHCTKCQKNVVNLSSFKRAEANAFLAAKFGTDLCVSYELDADGRPVSADPTLASRVGRVPAIAVALSLLACGPEGRETATPTPSGVTSRDAFPRNPSGQVTPSSEKTEASMSTPEPTVDTPTRTAGAIRWVPPEKK